MLPRTRKLALAGLFTSYFIVSHFLLPEVSYVILSAIWIFLGWKYTAALFSFLLVRAAIRAYPLYDIDLILFSHNLAKQVFNLYPEPLRTPVLYEIENEFARIPVHIYGLQVFGIAAIIIITKIVIYRFILLRLLPKEIMKV